MNMRIIDNYCQWRLSKACYILYLTSKYFKKHLIVTNDNSPSCNAKFLSIVINSQGSISYQVTSSDDHMPMRCWHMSHMCKMHILDASILIMRHYHIIFVIISISYFYE